MRIRDCLIIIISLFCISNLFVLFMTIEGKENLNKVLGYTVSDTWILCEFLIIVYSISVYIILRNIPKPRITRYIEKADWTTIKKLYDHLSNQDSYYQTCKGCKYEKLCEEGQNPEY